jgi:predicted transcriptional regulator
MLLEAQELARQENRTMSELVREALRSYQRQQESKKRWEEISALGSASAKRAGVHNEEDVVRVVREFRKPRNS